ncbi:MAG: leucine-rich repeat protein [Oscillospiraceae bacterium]|nr:leucine-rich repeat protein [Oscillospiraceae bacterium]
MKKLALLLLTLTLLFSVSSTALATEEDFIIEDGVLTYYGGSGGEVTIPDGVTSIGAGAFFLCKELTGVIIPQSVKTIEDNAFCDCTNLASVTLGTGVTTIGAQAFTRCGALTTINIGENVTSIGRAAFCGCTNLCDVTLPSTIASIAANMFESCTSLVSITVPDSVTVIERSAFLDCTALSAIALPDGVTSIGPYAFRNCARLAGIRIPESTTSIGKEAFKDCIALGDVYYAGSQTQWASIEVDKENDPLLCAAIHYGSTEPAAPDVPEEPSDATAYASTQTVFIDGKAVELQAYALKDASGNPTNYVKLRDVAHALNGTAAQFEVTWDGSVGIVTGSSYTPNGSEMHTPFSGDRAYTVPSSATKVDGAAQALAAITLTDDNGGGYTYYQLRDLGRALGFNVGWSAARGIFIETDKPYTDAD